MSMVHERPVEERQQAYDDVLRFVKLGFAIQRGDDAFNELMNDIFGSDDDTNARRFAIFMACVGGFIGGVCDNGAAAAGLDAEAYIDTVFADGLRHVLALD